MVGIRLPGREMRMREAAAEDMMDCRAEAVGAIMDHLADKPFMFLGHRLETLFIQRATLIKTLLDELSLLN